MPISQSVNQYSEWPLAMYRHIQSPAYYRKFRHIQAYSRPVKTFSHIESCHIQNPGYRYTQNSAKANAGIFRTLCNTRILRTLSYSEVWHIQNFAIFSILPYLGPEAYSKSCLYRHIFRHIQAYSIMTVITALTFFYFFQLILHTFQQDF